MRLLSVYMNPVYGLERLSILETRKEENEICPKNLKIVLFKYILLLSN